VRLFLGWTLLLLGCVSPAGEAGSGGILGEAVPSTEPSVVALYHVTSRPVARGGSLEVIDALGTGVLVCPSVVLTVMHNLGKGPLYVSNLSTIEEPRLVVAGQPPAPKRVYVPTVDPGARQLGYPIVLPIYEMLEHRPDGTEKLTTDGLAMFRIDLPFAPGLPYPVLTRAPQLRRGTPMAIHGYGLNALSPELGAGTRRMGVTSVDGLRAFPINFRSGVFRALGGARGLLQASGSALVTLGDSGGPWFETTSNGRPELTAITTFRALRDATSTEGGQSFGVALALHRPWFTGVRDALCAMRPVEQAALEPWIEPAPDQPPAGEITAADYEDPGPDEVIDCVCEYDDCSMCAPEDDLGDEESGSGDPWPEGF
jgi:hypothetical protein